MLPDLRHVPYERLSAIIDSLELEPVWAKPTLGMRSLGWQRLRSYLPFTPAGPSVCKSSRRAIQ